MMTMMEEKRRNRTQQNFGKEPELKKTTDERMNDERWKMRNKKKLVFKFGSIVRMLSFLSIDDDVDCSVISLNTQINRCYRHDIDD